MNTLEDKVQQVIEEHLAAEVGLDPDAFTVTAVENGVVCLRLHPGCMGCGTSVMAVISHLEAELPKYVPEVEIIEASY